MVRRHRSFDPDELQQGFEAVAKQKGKAQYYWVFEPTRRILFGPCSSEEEGYNLGYQKFPGENFEVVPLYTMNKAEASSRIKGLEFKKPDVSAEEAIKRLKHKF